MRRVVRGLAIALFICGSVLGAAHDEDEIDYCAELMELLSLQTHHAKVRQWGRVPTRDLERRIATLKERVFNPNSPLSGRKKVKAIG